METLAGFSVRMYSIRASTYDNSWHPDYSKRFISQVGISAGQRVLDVCCGTGLEAFLAAELVGDTGEVVGVDVTQPMLDEAIRKQTALAEQDPKTAARLRFLRGDVTRLDALPQLQKGSFDVVMCSNALVLLGDPSAAIAHWREYLRPGGTVAVDVPHERNTPALATLERVAKRMDLACGWPTGFAFIKSVDSLARTLEEVGFEVLTAVEMEKITGGGGQTVYAVEDADGQLDYVLNSHLALSAAVPELGTEEFREKARPIFREEFARDAVDGKVVAADSLYCYVARKK